MLKTFILLLVNKFVQQLCDSCPKFSFCLCVWCETAPICHISNAGHILNVWAQRDANLTAILPHVLKFRISVPLFFWRLFLKKFANSESQDSRSLWVQTLRIVLINISCFPYSSLLCWVILGAEVTVHYLSCLPKQKRPVWIPQSLNGQRLMQKATSFGCYLHAERLWKHTCPHQLYAIFDVWLAIFMWLWSSFMLVSHHPCWTMWACRSVVVYIYDPGRLYLGFFWLISFCFVFLKARKLFFSCNLKFAILGFLALQCFFSLMQRKHGNTIV